MLRSALCLVYACTNVVLAHSAESNFWSERRRAARHSNLLLAKASLPGTPIAEFLPRPTHPALPGQLGTPAPAAPAGWPESWGPFPALHASLKSARWTGPAGKGPAALIIEDLHSVTSAQEHVAELLSSLRSGVKAAGAGELLIGLEGGVGAFELEPFRAHRGHPNYRRASEAILKENLIQGPEFFALLAESEPSLWGVEDLKPYAENLKAFQAPLARRDGVLEDLDGLRKDVGRELKASLPPDLIRVNDAMELFSAGDLSAADLAQALAKAGADLRGFPNVGRLLRVMEQERALDFAAVERQRALAVDRLARALNPRDAQILADSAAQHRIGRRSLAAFLADLRGAVKAAGLSWSDLGAYRDYLAYAAQADAIDRFALFDELEGLRRSALDGVPGTPGKWLGLAEDLRLAGRMVQRELTPAEWDRWRQRREGLDRRLAELLPSRPPQALQALKEFEAFYTWADRRNEVMVKNLLAEARKRDAGVAALVAGGFHTRALERLLEAQGLSRIVLTPRVERLPEGNPHFDVLARAVPLSEYRAGEKLFLAAPRRLSQLGHSDSLTRIAFERRLESHEGSPSRSFRSALGNIGRWVQSMFGIALEVVRRLGFARGERLVWVAVAALAVLAGVPIILPPPATTAATETSSEPKFADGVVFEPPPGAVGTDSTTDIPVLDATLAHETPVGSSPRVVFIRGGTQQLTSQLEGLSRSGEHEGTMLIVREVGPRVPDMAAIPKRFSSTQANDPVVSASPDELRDSHGQFGFVVVPHADGFSVEQGLKVLAMASPNATIVVYEDGDELARLDRAGDGGFGSYLRNTLSQLGWSKTRVGNLKDAWASPPAPASVPLVDARAGEAHLLSQLGAGLAQEGIGEWYIGFADMDKVSLLNEILGKDSIGNLLGTSSDSPSVLSHDHPLFREAFEALRATLPDNVIMVHGPGDEVFFLFKPGSSGPSLDQSLAMVREKLRRHFLDKYVFINLRHPKATPERAKQLLGDLKEGLTGGINLIQHGDEDYRLVALAEDWNSSPKVGRDPLVQHLRVLGWDFHALDFNGGDRGPISFSLGAVKVGALMEALDADEVQRERLPTLLRLGLGAANAAQQNAKDQGRGGYVLFETLLAVRGIEQFRRLAAGWSPETAAASDSDEPGLDALTGFRPEGTFRAAAAARHLRSMRARAPPASPPLAGPGDRGPSPDGPVLAFVVPMSYGNGLIENHGFHTWQNANGGHGSGNRLIFKLGLMMRRWLTADWMLTGLVGIRRPDRFFYMGTLREIQARGPPTGDLKVGESPVSPTYLEVVVPIESQGTAPAFKRAEELAQAAEHILSGLAQEGDSEEAVREALEIIGGAVVVGVEGRVRGVQVVYDADKRAALESVLKRRSIARTEAAIHELQSEFPNLAIGFEDDASAPDENASPSTLGLSRFWGEPKQITRWGAAWRGGVEEVFPAIFLILSQVLSPLLGLTESAYWLGLIGFVVILITSWHDAYMSHPKVATWDGPSRLSWNPVTTKEKRALFFWFVAIRLVSFFVAFGWLTEWWMALIVAPVLHGFNNGVRTVIFGGLLWIAGGHGRKQDLPTWSEGLRVVGQKIAGGQQGYFVSINFDLSKTLNDLLGRDAVGTVGESAPDSEDVIKFEVSVFREQILALRDVAGAIDGYLFRTERRDEFAMWLPVNTEEEARSKLQQLNEDYSSADRLERFSFYRVEGQLQEGTAKSLSQSPGVLNMIRHGHGYTVVADRDAFRPGAFSDALKDFNRDCSMFLLNWGNKTKPRFTLTIGAIGDGQARLALPQDRAPRQGVLLAKAFHLARRVMTRGKAKRNCYVVAVAGDINSVDLTSSLGIARPTLRETLGPGTVGRRVWVRFQTIRRLVRRSRTGGFVHVMAVLTYRRSQGIAIDSHPFLQLTQDHRELASEPKGDMHLATVRNRLSRLLTESVAGSFVGSALTPNTFVAITPKLADVETMGSGNDFSTRMPFDPFLLICSQPFGNGPGLWRTVERRLVVARYLLAKTQGERLGREMLPSLVKEALEPLGKAMFVNGMVHLRFPDDSDQKKRKALEQIYRDYQQERLDYRLFELLADAGTPEAIDGEVAELPRTPFELIVAVARGVRLSPDEVHSALYPLSSTKSNIDHFMNNGFRKREDLIALFSDLPHPQVEMVTRGLLTKGAILGVDLTEPDNLAVGANAVFTRVHDAIFALPNGDDRDRALKIMAGLREWLYAAKEHEDPDDKTEYNGALATLLEEILVILMRSPASATTPSGSRHRDADIAAPLQWSWLERLREHPLAYFLLVALWETAAFQGLGLDLIPTFIQEAGGSLFLGSILGFAWAVPLFMATHTLVRWLARDRAAHWSWRAELAADFQRLKWPSLLFAGAWVLGSFFSIPLAFALAAGAHYVWDLGEAAARERRMREATLAVYSRLGDLYETASERAHELASFRSSPLPAGLVRAADIVGLAPQGDAVVHVTRNMLNGGALAPAEIAQLDTLKSVLSGSRERRIHFLVEGVAEESAVLTALGGRLGAGEMADRLARASAAVHSLSARESWREGRQVRLDRILSDLGVRSPSVFVVYQEGVEWYAGRWADRLAAFIVALAGGLSADMTFLIGEEIKRAGVVRSAA